MAVEAAMALGGRGLEPGGTLPRFFAEHRGRYNPRSARFTVAQILAWADQWRERTGEWPTSDSGDIPGIEGLNWAIVDNALRRGRGGLVRGSSLSRLLTAERGVLPVITRLTLNEEQVLAWADDWHERSGRWPTQTSGEIPGLGGINWAAVDNARARGSVRPAGRLLAVPPPLGPARRLPSPGPAPADAPADPGLGRRIPTADRELAPA